MPLRTSLAQVAVALVLLLVSAKHVSAQQLPVAPLKLVPELQSAGALGKTWKIGPILLDLPDTWANVSRPNIASLKGPEETVATFVALEVVKSAREGNYSVFSDKTRGPESFSKYAQWDDCDGKPERVVKPLSVPPGSKAMFAECNIEARPGAPGTYLQVTLYSATHIVQIHVMGDRKVVGAFLQSLKRVKWKNET
jgi:hypothetical protein